MMKKKEKIKDPQKKKPKLEQLHSTQMWSPVRDVKDGIVIGKDGKYTQILEFAPINFGLLPQEEQDSIAMTFGAAVKTFPKSFQIKILSRRADVEQHLMGIRDAMEKETNPQCKALQYDYAQQIRKEANIGVTKRFFLAYSYIAPPGLRRENWDNIKQSLHMTAYQMETQLSSAPCNNELISPIGNSAHTMDILYNCMCRAEAELKPFEGRMQDVIASRLMEGTYQENQHIPTNDFLAPRRIDPSAYSYLEVDGKYYAFGYIHRDSYPTTCVAGWVTMLVNMGAGIDLDIWVEKMDSKTTSTKLTYSMQITESNLSHSNNAAADIYALRNKYQSEKYIREGLTNDQALLYFSMMVTITASSPEELKDRFKLVQNHLAQRGLDLRPLHGNHDLAFRSSLPLNSPHRTITRFAKRNILSGDFGAAYPFTSYEISDDGGIRFARNLANDSPIFLDFFNRFKYSNGNMAVFGGTGSGKTYAIENIALLLREMQTRVVIIAPLKGHEYRPACKAIGGAYIALAPGSPHNINVMEIRQYQIEKKNTDFDDMSSSVLAAKINQLHTFFKILKPDISAAEKTVLEESLIATYKKYTITFRNKSLIDPINPNKYKPMPTLMDLDMELSKVSGSRGIRDVLYPFVKGSAKNFSQHTNVNLDNPYIVIDVSSMPDELMPVAIFIANDYVYDVIRADKTQRKAVIIDELSRMIGEAGSADAAQFVLTQAKTVRAYNCCLIVATQDTNDYFAQKGGSYGKGILANSKFKLVMKQDYPAEAETLGSELGLSKMEISRLMNYGRGEGIMVANRNHVEIYVTASPMVHNLIKTDAE